MTKKDRERFAPICPDFVIELKSSFHSLRFLQSKMDEYIQNGARLGWLIDPDHRHVDVYRPHREVEVLKNLSSVSGDPELPDSTLELAEVWDPDAE